MSEELKLCPHCGGKVRMASRRGDYCVVCTSCDMETILRTTSDVSDELRVRWNKRVSEERLPEVDESKESKTDLEVCHVCKKPLAWNEQYRRAYASHYLCKDCYDNAEMEQTPVDNIAIGSGQVIHRPEAYKAQSTAQQVLDFFTSRSPCRVVVCLSTRARLDTFWGKLCAAIRDQPSKGAMTTPDDSLTIGCGNKIVKTYNDNALSYIVGTSSFVDPVALMGHYIAGKPRGTHTMAVIDSRIPEDYVKAMETWAGLNIIQIDEEAKDGDEDKDDGCEPTIISQ